MVHDYYLRIVMKYPKPKNSFNPLLRKHLNADALFRALHTDFSKVSDFRQGDVNKIRGHPLKGLSMVLLT